MRYVGLIVLGFLVFAMTTLAYADRTYVNDREIFESIKNRPQLSKGTIIIAGRNLHDPNFSHTVILITEYDDLGTTGLIINRPVKTPAKKIFPAISQVTAHAGNLYIGGPIGFNDLQILVESKAHFQKTVALAGDIYLIKNPRGFNDLTRHAAAGMKVKILAGYAGWGIGQLETEIMRGDWYIWRADSRIVFSKNPETVWDELIELVSVQWAEYNPMTDLERQYPDLKM